MKRFLVPAIGLVLVVITVLQVRASRPAAPAQLAPRAAATESSAPISAEGRVVTYPGSQVTVATDVAGIVAAIVVDEKAIVHKGDIIATIKADDTRAALAEAKSHVTEADADIRLFELEVERAQKLFREDVGTKQAWEKAERDRDAAQARRLSALAEVHRLEAVLAKTVVTAPIDGTVITRSVHPGEMVELGAPIVTIANLGKTRIEAEIDEYDAARVTPGAPVTIRAEGFDGEWKGKVEEIPDSVTSRRLKPLDPSKPTDTRVLLVKVAMLESTPLKLGQRVDVRMAR